MNQIIIEFPIDVEITTEQQIKLLGLIKDICDNNRPKDMLLWPASVGDLITYMPITQEEEETGKQIEYDVSTFHIGCSIRTRTAGDVRYRAEHRNRYFSLPNDCDLRCLKDRDFFEDCICCPGKNNEEVK